MKKHMEVAMGHKRKIMCRFYQNNRCRFGKFCKYQHSETFETKQRNPEQQCRRFEKCSDFPNCKFEHREICKYQMSCRNQQCAFVHLSEPFLGRWMKAKRAF